jgi:antitoxin HicB
MPHYSVVLQWSEEDNGYIATIPELPGLSAFGVSLGEAIKQLTVAKKAFLDVMAEDGEVIPDAETLRPFSGQTRLRLPKSLHASLSLEAKKNGISLNTYIIMLLSEKNGQSQMRDSLRALESRIYSYMLTNSPAQLQATTGAVSSGIFEFPVKPTRGDREDEISGKDIRDPL